MATGTYEFDIEDVEYLRHGDRPLLARLFKPRGQGPFPAVIELHGGAWCASSRLADIYVHRPLAASGVLVASLDFRMPPEAPYPASVADIHYGIRWLKAHAAEFGSRADQVGLVGVSSGGHQAMLVAMRPRDPRYAAIPMPDAPAVDATVRYVVMCWPVISPLGRYRYARKLKAGGKPYPDFVDGVIPSHDAYWKNEEAMAEGDPMLMLERGERVEKPPVLYIQGGDDKMHPRADLDRFVADYREAGGQLQLELFAGADRGFMRETPESPAAKEAAARLVEFVHRNSR